MSFAQDLQENQRALTNRKKNTPKIRRNNGKSKSHARVSICADFETTTLEEDCRVWAWGWVDVDKSDDLEEVNVGTQIKGLMDELSEFNSTCYFHNLRFDGHFIIY